MERCRSAVMLGISYLFADLSGETGDDLIAMGNTLLALSTVEIGTVDNTAFDEAVSTIGAIKGFSRDQLQAWASKAKKVMIPFNPRRILANTCY